MHLDRQEIFFTCAALLHRRCQQCHVVASFHWWRSAHSDVRWVCRHNGKHLGAAFRNITSVPLWPTIGLHRFGTENIAIYDIDRAHVL